MIEESIRILSIYIQYNIDADAFKKTVRDYILSYGDSHRSEKVRRISIWSIDKLGLLCPENSDNKSLLYKRRAKKIVKAGIDDNRGSVREMANRIIQKYQKVFLK